MRYTTVLVLLPLTFIAIMISIDFFVFLGIYLARMITILGPGPNLLLIGAFTLISVAVFIYSGLAELMEDLFGMKSMAF